MANFQCEICKTDILDSPEGYTTGCSHYPKDVSNLARKSPILFIADVLAGKHLDTVAGRKVKEIMDSAD